MKYYFFEQLGFYELDGCLGRSKWELGRLG